MDRAGRCEERPLEVASLRAFAWTLYEMANRQRLERCANSWHWKPAFVFVLVGVSSVKGVVAEIR